jgi:hypothetical protein
MKATLKFLLALAYRLALLVLWVVLLAHVFERAPDLPRWGRDVLFVSADLASSLILFILLIFCCGPIKSGHALLRPRDIYRQKSFLVAEVSQWVEIIRGCLIVTGIGVMLVWLVIKCGRYFFLWLFSWFLKTDPKAI